MRKVNLLHIITELELGGAQKSTLHILQYLNREKFNLHFISSPRGILAKRVKKFYNIKFIRGFEVLRDETKTSNRVNIYFLSCLKREISPINDLRAFLHIFFYIRKNKIDIVHTHSSKAGILGRLAAKLTKVKHIFHTIHGFSFHPYQNYIVRKFYILLEKIAATVTDKLIVVTKTDIDKGLKEKIGNREKYVLIREGIEKDLFTLSEDVVEKKKSEFNIRNNTKVVGMIACLKPQKAPIDFVRIAKIISDMSLSIKFLLIGDGFLRSNVIKTVNKLRLNGDFLILGWREDIYEIMPILDIVVLTSYWEGLPHTLLEAMYCSKPVIAYGVDGVCEVIKNGVNGFIIRPGDIKTFTERVFQLLKDDYLATRMGKNGYEMVKDRFDIEEMVCQTEQLYLTQMQLEW